MATMAIRNSIREGFMHLMGEVARGGRPLGNTEQPRGPTGLTQAAFVVAFQAGYLAWAVLECDDAWTAAYKEGRLFRETCIAQDGMLYGWSVTLSQEAWRRHLTQGGHLTQGEGSTGETMT